jgi:hypothetical protein
LKQLLKLEADTPINPRLLDENVDLSTGLTANNTNNGGVTLKARKPSQK